jgi:hypothetical protein
LCARVENLALEGRLDLYGGRKRYLFFAASGAAVTDAARQSEDCPAAM